MKNKAKLRLNSRRGLALKFIKLSWVATRLYFTPSLARSVIIAEFDESSWSSMMYVTIQPRTLHLLQSP